MAGTFPEVVTFRSRTPAVVIHIPEARYPGKRDCKVLIGDTYLTATGHYAVVEGAGHCQILHEARPRSATE